MGHIFDAMVTFFQEEKLPFTQVEGEPILLGRMKGDNCSLNCSTRQNDKDTLFAFHSIYPVPVPQDKRQVACEFFTRVNFGLPLGNFEMDMDDGEVRYKTSIAVGTEPLSSVVLSQLVYINASTADIFFPGFMEVIFSDISPKEAMDRVIEKLQQ